MPDQISLAVVVQPLEQRHYPAVARIYAQGIATGNATLQTEAPDWQTWDAGHLSHSRLVVLAQGEIAGWAALTAVSGRCVYRGVAEVSVYIGADYQGKGMGKLLLNKLISYSEENGIWTLQAGIFKENKASLNLHQSCGFRIVGLREKIGQLNGLWRDVYLLERRSTVVGV
jgi:phosphinothricin acetyltransferase